MSIPCGIDLGTTYSAISYFDEATGRVVTVELVNHADGAREIRSVVYYPNGGGVVVGETAYQANVQNPDRVIIGVKRSMGQPWKSKIDGVERTAPEISAEILKVLIEEAGAALGDPIRDVVITVPAYFDQAERAATEEAGRLAGVNVVGILSEPHAAALAFVAAQLADIRDRDLLVYDLGGGTFDITLIRVESVAPDPAAATQGGSAADRSYRLITLHKAGNSALGGLDWDKALAELVAEKAQDQAGLDVSSDPNSAAYLLEQCEKAKRSLSRDGSDSVTIAVDLSGHAVVVTRKEFEDRTLGLLGQTESLVKQVLQDAIPLFQDRARKAGHPAPDSIGLEEVKAQVDILLAGGSTKMPMVGTMLRQLTGKEPLRYGNPHLLVSMGAAYWAHLLHGNALPPPPPVKPAAGSPPTSPPQPQGKTILQVIDITRDSLGVAALRANGRDASGATRYEEFHDILVPKGSPYGTSRSQEYSKVRDGLTEIQITLFRGESSKLEDCKEVRTFTVSGLPANGKSGETIVVTLSVDKTSGILRATAVDRASGKTAEVEVDERC